MNSSLRPKDSDRTSMPLHDVRICLVEDDKVSAKVYTKWLQVAGAKVQWLKTVEEFNHELAKPAGWTSHPETAPDLLLCDLVLPDGSGTEILLSWRKFFPRSSALMITAFATVENAVEAMKMGAFDFIRKPVQPEELVLAIRRAHENSCLIKENATLSTAVRIFGMAQTLSGISEKESLLKTFARVLHRESNAVECFVFLYQETKESIECLFDCRTPGVTRSLPELIIDKMKPVFEAKIKEKNPQSFNLDLSQAPLPAIHDFSSSHFMVVELKSQTGNAAFVSLLFKNDHCKEIRESSDFYPIILQASRGYHSADVADWMAALSCVDDLTGLYNQRFLDVALENEIARANRYGTPFSVVFCDLDKFKAVNDVHGHIVGSQILREASLIFRKNLRDSDLLMRYGGDEFVAILPNTQMEGARIFSERIRASFESTLFDVRKETGIESAYNLNVTASIGIASYPTCSLDGKVLVQKADEAMYESKRRGKNCVSLAPVRCAKAS